MIRTESFTGAAAHTFIPDIARLRIEIFRSFPYLYEGDMEYEQDYLQTFMDAPDSVVVVAFDDAKVIGASTGLPLIHETDNVKQPWQLAGFEVDKVFYYGESVLQQEYRGRGLGVRFFEERESWARSLGRMEWLTFCAVVRSADHPARPLNYQPLDEFWHKRGFQAVPGLLCRMDWQDVGQAAASSKALQFWRKPIGN